MPEIIVGSVGVQLVPSAKGFQEKARQLTRDLEAHVELKADTEKAKGEIDDASRNRDTKVDVKAETKGAKAELEALQKSMRTKSLDVQARTAGAKVKIGELQREIGDTKARIAVNADDVGAKAKLRVLENTHRDLRVRVDADTGAARLDLERLRASAAGKKVTITAAANTEAANAKLNHAARNRTSKIDAKADISGFSTMTTAIAALGPALIPVTAAVGGLGAALAAPLGAATLGGGLFGLTAGLAIKSLEKTNKAMAKLQTAIDADKLAVDTATTASGKKSAMAQLATDTKSYHDMLKSLAPAQKEFLGAQSTIVAKFQDFSQNHAAAIFSPLTQVMRLGIKEMPKLGPVIDTVSHALSGLITEAGKSGALDKVLKFLTKASGPAITGLGHILGNVATGIGGIVSAAAPLGTSVLGGIESLTRKFANFGRNAKHNGFSDFLAYAKEVGPGVKDTLGSIVKAVGHVLRAAAPVGKVSLGVIKGIADVIAKIPPKALTGAVVGFAGLAVALKGIAAAKGAAGIISKLSFGKLLGGGGGLGGGIAGRVAKGVTPVFVTNEGFGKGGGGLLGDAEKGVGAGGAAAAGEVTAGTLVSGVLLPALLTAGGLALENAFINWREKNTPRALPYVPAGVRYAPNTKDSPGQILEYRQRGAATADQYQKLIDYIEGLHPGTTGNARKAAFVEDTSLSKLALKGPAGATNLISQIGVLKSITGLNLKQLLKQLPGLNALLKKAGGGVAALGLQMLKLPKDVRTKITADGAEVSGKQVVALTKKYHLTPSQVKTLVTLLGQKGALDGAIKLGKQYHLTPKQVKTVIGQYGAKPTGDEVDKLAKKYHLTPHQIMTLIKADDKASPLIGTVKDRLAALNHKTAKTFVETENGKALSAIGVVRDALKTLQNKTIHITTIREARDVSYQAKRFQNEAVNKHATGGPIFGPGTGTSDSIPARLSNGEYVINARATAHNRALLEKINASVPAFAAGGPVAPGGPASSGGGVTVQIGEVRAQDYRDFMRQAKVRADRAAMDGVRRR